MSSSQFILSITKHRMVASKWYFIIIQSLYTYRHTDKKKGTEISNLIKLIFKIDKIENWNINQWIYFDWSILFFLSEYLLVYIYIYNCSAHLSLSFSLKHYHTISSCIGYEKNQAEASERERIDYFFFSLMEEN